MEQPRIYEFTDLKKAINYYTTMEKKLQENAVTYPRIWYEVTLQSSNLTGLHLVTIHIGIHRKDNEKL
jgi:hypothetical protein